MLQARASCLTHDFKIADHGVLGHGFFKKTLLATLRVTLDFLSAL
jgi:hypothetical protein